MKSTFSVAVTLLAVFLLSSGGLLVTRAATPSSDYNSHSATTQQLSLGIQGGVVSAGNQHYILSQEGKALVAVVSGNPLIPSTTHLQYYLDALVQGTSTTGSGSFTLTGLSVTGSYVFMRGNFEIVGSIPAVCFPSMSITGTCASSDTSEVPMAFVGAASVQISSNMHGQDAAPTVVTMMFESPYFNPFGNAITFGSVDNSIAVVTNYTRATIDWSNVNDAGMVSGTLGTTPLAGEFLQVASEHENLVTGKAQDFGVLSMSQMTNLTSGNPVSSLDATGAYTGTSTIPHSGALGCGSSTVVSGIQTCTQTGFQDSGRFLLRSGQEPSTSIIVGSYSTTWTVPAFGFESSVTATVIN